MITDKVALAVARKYVKPHSRVTQRGKVKKDGTWPGTTRERLRDLLTQRARANRARIRCVGIPDTTRTTFSHFSSLGLPSRLRAKFV